MTTPRSSLEQPALRHVHRQRIRARRRGPSAAGRPGLPRREGLLQHHLRRLPSRDGLLPDEHHQDRPVRLPAERRTRSPRARPTRSSPSVPNASPDQLRSAGTSLPRGDSGQVHAAPPDRPRTHPRSRREADRGHDQPLRRRAQDEPVPQGRPIPTTSPSRPRGRTWTPSSTSSSSRSAATASSSAPRSPSWPAPSGYRPGWPRATPPASTTRSPALRRPRLRRPRLGRGLLPRLRLVDLRPHPELRLHALAVQGRRTTCREARPSRFMAKRLGEAAGPVAGDAREPSCAAWRASTPRASSSSGCSSAGPTSPSSTPGSSSRHRKPRDPDGAPDQGLRRPPVQQVQEGSQPPWKKWESSARPPGNPGAVRPQGGRAARTSQGWPGSERSTSTPASATPYRHPRRGVRPPGTRGSRRGGTAQGGRACPQLTNRARPNRGHLTALPETPFSWYAEIPHPRQS